MSVSEVGCEAGSREVRISASDNWKLDVQYTGSQHGWARLNVESGVQGGGKLELSYDENTSGQDRSLKLVGTSGKKVSVWKFKQSSRSSERIPSDVKQCKPGSWLELPAVSEADGLWFFSHRHQVRGVETRDWSYNWDSRNLVAHWVAYPLNRGLIAGSGVRTDAWNYDPLLPSRYQPNLNKSYHGRRWQRGHQLPSADRQIRSENQRTFYYTNMTPQAGELNENTWAELESRVRSWSLKFDTLYVVTGCTVSNSIGRVDDASGKEVTIPGGYFKALLGYSRGGTASMVSASTGGYTSIAFYFENRSADNVMKHSMTVAELEKKTGMDFFVNLPSRIGETLTSRVENAEDEFWTNN